MNNESFLIFTEDKIKILFARGKSDEEIAKKVGIPISVVERVLSSCRLQIKITGISVSDTEPVLWKVIRS